MNPEEIDEDEEEDGWKILKPGVVLFETTIGFVEKISSHFVLNDDVRVFFLLQQGFFSFSSNLIITLTDLRIIQKQNFSK